MEVPSTKLLSKSKSLDFGYDDSKFLFKNRKFISIDGGPSNTRGMPSTTSSSQCSGDSDPYSMNWGSFSEDDESEVGLNSVAINTAYHCVGVYSRMSHIVKFIT